MKRYWLGSLGLLGLMWCATIATGKETIRTQKEASCRGDFGTSLIFEDSPKEAAQKAKKEEKLVFILHISGHFEDPKLT